MKRTIQTAEALNVPYEQWKVLNEIDAVSITGFIQLLKPLHLNIVLSKLEKCLDFG